MERCRETGAANGDRQDAGGGPQKDADDQAAARRPQLRGNRSNDARRMVGGMAGQASGQYRGQHDPHLSAGRQEVYLTADWSDQASEAAPGRRRRDGRGSDRKGPVAQAHPLYPRRAPQGALQSCCNEKDPAQCGDENGASEARRAGVASARSHGGRGADKRRRGLYAPEVFPPCAVSRSAGRRAARSELGAD